MRIIGGKFKRHTLRSPEGDEARPTTDRSREAIFNLVQHRVNLVGANVLDLFAGTGALGLEALSRGATSVIFVDTSQRLLELARRNAAALEDDLPCTFVRQDALAFLENQVDRRPGATFDLILADPPYDWPNTSRLVDLAMKVLAPEGLFVLEHDCRIAFSEHVNLETERSYGRTHISLFAFGAERVDTT